MPALLDLLRRIPTPFAAPSARRSLSRLDLSQSRKPRPHGVFDEPATLPRGHEIPHLLQESVFEDHIHASHSEASTYTQEDTSCA